MVSFPVTTGHIFAHSPHFRDHTASVVWYSDACQPALQFCTDKLPVEGLQERTIWKIKDWLQLRELILLNTKVNCSPQSEYIIRIIYFA